MSALLVAKPSIARGVRPIPAYAIAVVAASVLAAVVQFSVRHWLGVYTNGDRPGVEMSRRRMQMVYAGSDTLRAIQTVHRTFHGSFEVQLRHRRELLPVSSPYTHLFKQL